MKIIHCADIHLDSPLSSKFSVMQAKERRQELFNTFADMVRFAYENNVRVIIIAGDLFDSCKVSRKTCDDLCDLISKYEMIDFVYVAGNHDEQTIALKEAGLSNLKLFEGDGGGYRYGNVMITGINNPSIINDVVLRKEDINIVVMHTQIDTTLEYQGRFQDKNIDYLALGHVHKRCEGKIDLRGKWAYSGCLEPRGFDECAQTGFYLLETDEEGIKNSFVPFGNRKMWEIKIDAMKLDISRLDDLIESYAKGKVSERDFIKLELIGAVDSDTLINTGYIEKLLQEKYYMAKVKDSTRRVHTDTPMTEMSLRGIFERIVKENEEDEQLMLDILKCGREAFDVY